MPPPNILTRISRFLGLHSLNATGRDAYLIITLRSLRMFSAGIPSLILALFFSSLHFADARIGLFMTLTLLGDVLLSLVLTLVADRIGRRRVLFMGSAMMAVSGVAFAMSENFWVLLVAAVFGVISVTGADCGPFRAVEESILSGLTTEGKGGVGGTRSDVLAWYVTATTLAGSIGTEVAGRVVQFVEKRAGAGDDGREGSKEANERKAFHVLFWGYAIFGAVGCLLCLGLSRRCEVYGEVRERRGKESLHGSGEARDEEEEVLLESITPSTTDGFEDQTPGRHSNDIRVPPSQKDTKKKSYISQISIPTRRIMYKLWILLAIDSLADGMTPYSLMNYYVDQKFHLSKSTLGDITSASQFLCAVSSIFAGPLSKKIGLINTMVFTHLPSSIASAFIPLPNSVGWTVSLLLFRAALNSMDQAPRTAFIAAVVKPEERTGVMGITSMLRTLAMSVGPSITGLLAGNDTFWAAFLATGICRITYDLGLWVLFVNVKVGKDHDEEVDDDGGVVRDRGSVDLDDVPAWERAGDEVEGLLSGSDSEDEGGKGFVGRGKDGEGAKRGSKHFEDGGLGVR